MDQAAELDLYAKGAWLFDQRFYVTRSGDLTPERLQRAMFASALDHFRAIGDREGRSPGFFFDPRFYVAQLPSLEARQASTEGPFHHYLRTLEEGGPERRTSVWFDPAFYRARYDGVPSQRALHHYLTNDSPTDFDPLPEFSESFYLATYPDVASAIEARRHRCGYLHFLWHGAEELRKPRKDFDLGRYVRDNPQVQADLAAHRAPNAFAHYLTIGRVAGFRGGPAALRRLNLDDAVELFQLRARAMLPGLVRGGLDFSCRGTPSVTVIIATQDRFVSLMATLASLRGAYDGAMEVLVLDRGSRDETPMLERFVTGLRVLAFTSEADALPMLNAAIPCASAPAILLLSDTVEVMRGALHLGLQRLISDETAGAVGGLVLRADGSPAEAAPAAVREVDFCADEFLLIRTETLRRIGALDETLGDAAVADACLRIIQAGQRVIYDPAVVVQRTAPAPERTRHLPDRRAAKPARELRRVLFIDDSVPLRLIGSGFVRSNDLVRAMLTLDCDVTVFPLGPSKGGPATLAAEMPEQAEVILDGDVGELRPFLRARGRGFDVIWIARTHNLRLVRSALEAVFPDRAERPLIVLDTEAIASLRAGARAAVRGETFDQDAALRQEFAQASFCDRVVAVSAREAQVLTELGVPAVSVIGHTLPPRPGAAPFAARAGLLFLGAMHEAGSPNHDALGWFIASVLPLIEQELGWQTALTVAGYAGPGVLAEEWQHHPRVTLIGAVADVAPLYEQHRVFIAPTRFAAGLPYKLHEAAAFGLPAVATSLLAGQLGWTDGNELLAADVADPAGFAARVVRLYRDEALWLGLREAALTRVAQDAAYEPFRAALNRVLRGVAPRVAAPVGD